MSFYIKNITRCSLCEKLIANFKESLLLPYLADPDSPLASFVRNYVHRTCFDAWEEHDNFVQGSFELEERMIEKGYYEKVILYDRYCIIDYKKQEDVYHIIDCYSILEIRITIGQARKLGAFFEKIKTGEHPRLEVETLVFTVKDKDVLVADHDEGRMKDEIKIPHSRINDYIFILNYIKRYNESHDLLYHYNEEGYEGYDLSEVQLLEEKNADRIEGLKALLHSYDRYIAYQAMLILVSWAIPEGFETLDRFMTEKWEEKEDFEPHRLYGEDNVFDVMANALHIATFNGKTEQELYPYIKRFLDLYGEKFFESNLKMFLLKADCRPIFREIEQAMKSALQHERYYQASQLFPVLVHYDRNTFNEYKDVFIPLISFDNRITCNMEEAGKIGGKD
ncbi:uncharacterized protein CHSO_3451 [Chryseobacterium sp. StRB126]|uniref:hypothetical protein n=1 Tax=Chryseobacterium sp. StRB126 TaxID=878220 RepID=UPI0004E99061|nr:hypothetical protein [Chryseobacterium sp. StRB126]BAP32488.1 uncharacterized protein CHSO_3451 [Chryseobacterium sp. StRB126]